MKKVALLLCLALAIFAAAAGSPKGWKWDKSARADSGGPSANANGWSWNDAEVVAAVGDEVAVADDGSTLGATAPADTDPSIGDAVLVATNGDKTLVGFQNGDGGMSWTTGWSWND